MLEAVFSIQKLFLSEVFNYDMYYDVGGQHYYCTIHFDNL